jgi:hypothetical protein
VFENRSISAFAEILKDFGLENAAGPPPGKDGEAKTRKIAAK